MNHIKDKTVLITGGASGIGYMYAEDLLRNGAKCVAILDLNTAQGVTAVATLEKEFGKGRAMFFTCDISNAQAFTECFQKVVDHFKVLDIMINNAGIINDHNWELSISLNVNALIRGSLLALAHMGMHKGGHGGTVVNIASIVGLHPVDSLPIYSATKHAVIGFSRAMQHFHSTNGVRFLVMCPGVTLTALFDDMAHKVIDFIDENTARKEVEVYPSQAASHVSKAMVDLIENGKSGDIWVCEGGKPAYAIDIPHYSKLAIPM